MMKRIICIVLLFFLSNQQCTFREKFVSQQKAEEFVDLHNKLRNQVALGNIKNTDRQLQQASNMNFVVYDRSLASKAQDCADRCPGENDRCVVLQPILIQQNALNEGYIIYKGDSQEGGAVWSSKLVMDTFYDNRVKSRQILFAPVEKFGCGRVQSFRRGNNGILDEIIVCFYDRKVSLTGDVYTRGGSATNCIRGKKAGYLGLCSTQSAQRVQIYI